VSVSVSAAFPLLIRFTLHAETEAKETFDDYVDRAKGNLPFVAN